MNIRPIIYYRPIMPPTLLQTRVDNTHC